jgi:hypothetical protein
MHDFAKVKAKMSDLVATLGPRKLSAYVIGLGQLWSNKELTAEERRKMPAMLRRELLLDKSDAEPKEMSAEALGRVMQSFQLARSAERMAEVETDGDAA